MGGNRDDFSAKTKDLLAKQVAFRCSNPHCRQLTCGAGEKKNSIVNIGVAAHICAAAPGGKRYDADMTRNQRKDSSNGIWLCQSCAKLIDSDEVRYTVEVLQEWKRQSIEDTRRKLEFRPQECTERIQNMEQLFRDLPEGQNLMFYLDLRHRLFWELDALVQKMEEIERKANLVGDTCGGVWAEIYATQFEHTRALFQDIDLQIHMLRDQAQGFAQMVGNELDAPGDDCRYAPGFGGVAINAEANRFSLIAARARELVWGLRTVWKTMEEAETGFAKLDEARKNHIFSEIPS